MSRGGSLADLPGVSGKTCHCCKLDFTIVKEDAYETSEHFPEVHKHQKSTAVGV